jgi:sugar O-acyltransferase (sialic acid O-acetyltransferase NeuD family)
MRPIVVPQEDVNSETAVIVTWLVDDHAPVKQHQVVCQVETSKVVYEVVAPDHGWLVQGYARGQEVPFNVPIAYVAPVRELIDEARRLLSGETAEAPDTDELESFAGKITERARRLIAEYGIPVSALPTKAVLTERDLLPLIDSKDDYYSPLDQRVYRLDHARVSVMRTLVLGAGLGAMQVVDILSHDPRVVVIGYVDDNPELHGATIYGLPVLGPVTCAEEWFAERRYDAAIISVSTSNAVRRRWYELLKRLGVPLVNAIDPSARLTRGVMLGEGNVICAFVHIGVETRLGNNNFLSAYTSVDHHNLWGSHITTGPAVATSGCVEVGDDVKMGTGIYIQPHVTVGKGAQIASGAILTRSVPPLHVAKTRVNVELAPVR